MDYLLIKKTLLMQRGIYLDAQELSDGRVVLSINALKVLGDDLAGVEKISQSDLERILSRETEIRTAQCSASQNGAHPDRSEQPTDTVAEGDADLDTEAGPNPNQSAETLSIGGDGVEQPIDTGTKSDTE